MKFPTLTITACALGMFSISWQPVQAAEALTGSDRPFVMELVAAQQDYLIAVSAQGYFTREPRTGGWIIGQFSLEKARARLHSLGMTDQEIAELERNGVPVGMAPLHAEAAGAIEGSRAVAMADVQPAGMGPRSSQSTDLVLQSHHEGIVPAVELALIKAIIVQESSFRVDAVRFEPRLKDTSYGLMQLLSGTAKSLGYVGHPLGLLDPATNLFYGVLYLRRLMNTYGRIEDVIAAYNAGRPMRVESGTYVNQGYVNGVLKHLRHFRAETAGAGS